VNARGPVADHPVVVDGPGTGWLAELDIELYRFIALQRHGRFDGMLPELSRVADRSGLWMALAAGIAATGGRRGRATAVRAVAAIGITSLVANAVLKPLWRRSRPPQAEVVPIDRHVPLPGSTSFPSGHSASAAAFTAVVAHGEPVALLPVAVLAFGVCFSRVHSGVHYPSDVLAGVAVGAGIGSVLCAWSPVR
jgi:membrane-associated phospholipid phosphatase